VTPCRIFVVDDEPAIRARIVELLAAGLPESELVVGEVASVVTSITAGDLLCLDFRLADGSWPAKTVAAACARGAAVVVVTSGASPAELGECLRAGASGVVLKSELEGSLVEAGRTALGDGLVLNFATAQSLGPLALLLDRDEQRCVQLLGHGLSPEEAKKHSALGEQPTAWIAQRIRVHLRDRLAGAPQGVRRVCIVDDHPLTAGGLAELLRAAIHGVSVTFEASISALLSSPVQFDLVLLDVMLNDGTTPADNVAAAVSTGAAVALLTGVQPSGAADVDLVAAAFRGGARALLLKSDPPAEVLDAIVEVMRGSLHINRNWAEVMRFQSAQLARLTPTERKVFTLRREGLTRAEIAAALVCSEETVKGHCRDIGLRLTADWLTRISQ